MVMLFNDVISDINSSPRRGPDLTGVHILVIQSSVTVLSLKAITEGLHNVM